MGFAGVLGLRGARCAPGLCLVLSRGACGCLITRFWISEEMVRQCVLLAREHWVCLFPRELTSDVLYWGVSRYVRVQEWTGSVLVRVENLVRTSWAPGRDGVAVFSCYFLFFLLVNFFLSNREKNTWMIHGGIGC